MTFCHIVYRVMSLGRLPHVPASGTNSSSEDDNNADEDCTLVPEGVISSRSNTTSTSPSNNISCGNEMFPSVARGFRITFKNDMFSK